MGNHYILVTFDYLSKWIKVIAYPTNEARVFIKMFKKTIFMRFEFSILAISDGGSHFIAIQFENLMEKYGVRHKVVTPYHPQKTIRWKSPIRR